MWSPVFTYLLYSMIVISLFAIDYALGNGFWEGFQKGFCKFVCFVRKSLRDKETEHPKETEVGKTISFPIILGEIALLAFTVFFLRRYRQKRGKDRIDELLQESKEALRQTNEFLEKWRLRRLNWHAPTEYSYLDEEPQEIKPLKLEVPILHMAIVDTRGPTRGQPESGDAGDTIKVLDSTLLSVSSLIDENDSDIANFDEGGLEDLPPQKTRDSRNFYLWDVMEEDSTQGDST